MSRKNKFDAIRTKLDGIQFDSKAEAARYAKLVLLQRGGVIKDLMAHQKFALRVNDQLICNFLPDFSYIENGKWIIEDSKSEATITPVFRIKAKLFQALYPSAELRITGI